MKECAIIIGSSTTGKTTLIHYLRPRVTITIEESDDVLTAMNGVSYPYDVLIPIGQ